MKMSRCLFVQKVTFSWREWEVADIMNSLLQVVKFTFVRSERQGHSIHIMSVVSQQSQILKGRY